MSIYEVRQLPAPAGSASEPSVAFLGDSNTGIYSPGADQLAISTAGTGRVFFASDGKVGIGASAPNRTLDVAGTARVSSVLTMGSYIQGTTQLDLYGDSSSSSGVRLDSSGRLLVGTSSNTGGALLQVNGDRIRVATAKTPASATDTGSAGEICWDASYIYVCTATNTWKRTAIATW